MDIIANIVDTSKSYRIQETPYFKRLRLREESDLVHLREAKEIIERAAENFLEPQIRRIRLKKLYEQIQHNIEKNEQRIRRRRYIPKTTPKMIRDRITQGKIKGNEFSQRNRKNIPLSKLYVFRKAFQNTKIKEIPDSSFSKRKEYGQQVKEYNKQHIENQRNNQTSEAEYRPKTEGNRKNKYGQYYTLRNRLNFKHSIKEFDEEYSDLLLECLLFEKEHLDVCGFLEEQVRSSPSIRSKLMSKLTHSAPSSQVTISTYTSGSDLISLNSTNTSDSKILSQYPSTIEPTLKSAASSSKEVFNTCTKILSRESEKSCDRSDDSSSSATETLKLSSHSEKDQKAKNTFIWKTQAIKYSNKFRNTDRSSSDDTEIIDSIIDEQEKEVRVQRFASVITKTSSKHLPTIEEPQKHQVDNKSSNIKTITQCQSQSSKTTSTSETEANNDSSKFNSSVPSTEQIIAKAFVEENFDEMLENIISHKGNADGQTTLADELSNLLVAYGTKMIKEATNGEVDQNLIKAFALKQQTSIRKAFKNITTRDF